MKDVNTGDDIISDTTDGITEMPELHFSMKDTTPADLTAVQKEEREKYLSDSFEKLFGTMLEEVSYDLYSLLYGEVEARNTADGSEYSSDAIIQYPSVNDGRFFAMFDQVELYYDTLINGDFDAAIIFKEEVENERKKNTLSSSGIIVHTEQNNTYSGATRTASQVHGGSKENGLGVNYEGTDASGGRTRERRRTKQGSGSGNASFESDLGLRFSLRDSDGNTLTPQQQAKYTSNTNPTKDFDIRFSMKDTTPADLTAVQEENESLNSALRLTEEFTKLAA